MTKVAFQYNGYELTKMLLFKYIEEHIQGNRHKVVVEAFYEYIKYFDEEEAEQVLLKYMKEADVTGIKFDNFEKDFEIITNIIEKGDIFDKIFKELRLSSVRQYEFEENKGVCGVLLPTGEFLKCGYTQHSILTENLTWEEQNASVYLSSRMFSEGEGNVSFSPLNKDMLMTEAQVKWVIENYKYCDTGQQYMFRLFMRREFE